MINGAIVYQGASCINGDPVVLIVTSICAPSVNKKTSDMLQTWILPDNDKTPQQNVHAGSDVSVCGGCKRRHYLGGNCYVKPWRDVGSVFKSYKRGNYPFFNNKLVKKYPRIKSVPLRIGSYGDPAAIPFIAWFRLLRHVSAWTGYTHQWQRVNFDHRLKKYVVASVDNFVEKDQAQSLGFKTFRVSNGVNTQNDEISCPASIEQGNRLNCAECLRCNGQSGNVAIKAH